MNRKPLTKPVINRYKMFKYGKHWVYAGITLASVGTTLLLTTTAQAAATNPNDATPNAAVAAQPTTAALTTAAVTDGAAAPATTPEATVPDAEGNGDGTTPTDNQGTTNDVPTTPGSENNLPTSQDGSQADNQRPSDAGTASDAGQPSQGSTDGSSEDTGASAAQPSDGTVNSDAASDDQSGDATPADSSEVTDSSTAGTPATSTNGTDQSEAATTPTLKRPATVSAVATSAPLTTAASHGPVYTTDDKTLYNDGKVTIEQTGPYAITWKQVSNTTTTETRTVTLDASDFVNLVKTINDATGNTAKIAAAKAKYQEMLAQLKALPSKIASQLVGNLLYQVVFTGTGSQALSNFRTALDPTRYDISNTWTGLDPVAYAADRAAAETYYPAAVTWYNNVAKETWSLPEYNQPTQYVRATYIQNGDATKTVVIGQGWTERPDWIGYVSKIWYDMGYNILMPSQRGQFLSDGNDMTFGYQDKYDWLNWVRLVDERNGKDSQVVFYGQSLGADTVIEAASVPGLSKSVKAVIADAGYATLPELGSSLYNKAVAAVSTKLQSVGLPAITSIPFLSYDQVLAVINNRLMKQQGFSIDDVSGVSAASKVTVPLMLIHTEDDAFIPYTQSLELAAANNSKIKTVWILPGEVGGHAGANNAVLQYTQHIKDFLAEATATATDVDTGEATVPDGTTTTPDETTATDGHTTPETQPDAGTTGQTTTSGQTGSQATTNNGQPNGTDQPKNQTPTETDNAAVTDQPSADNGQTSHPTITVSESTSTDQSTDQSLTSTTAPRTGTVEQTPNATTAPSITPGTTTLAQAEPEDVDAPTNPVTLAPTTTKAATPTQPSTAVALNVLTDTNASPVSAAAIAAAHNLNASTVKPIQNADQLITQDHSGSVVTASLMVDESTPVDATTTLATVAPVATTAVVTPTPLVDHTTAPTSAAADHAKAATLPQTSERPQSWLAAFGASLAALATGLWASLRRHFNR
ncbi:LPXTG cell wall anchor domain-containing protein [Lactiplantibacillus garii]|uniref:LPXTG cell wall anchor domain-containing protein n=1 Tax=Lactiplantibacillus garii TaxID=2306423 RepID=A0A3R8LJ30_9LACO|nr:alpha/beta hydrolase [Lactiplantibacillus garii]RRK09827.1 LPXTG cell wall anchor domain-containing protein [Lactiplantibacillus garii]